MGRFVWGDWLPTPCSRLVTQASRPECAHTPEPPPAAPHPSLALGCWRGGRFLQPSESIFALVSDPVFAPFPGPSGREVAAGAGGGAETPGEAPPAPGARGLTGLGLPRKGVPPTLTAAWASERTQTGESRLP